MNRSKVNIDKDQNANTSFVFSLPFSLFENVDTKVATVDRKRKATWETGGIAKKKRIHWNTQVKKQLFNTETTDKKKNNSGFITIKQTKALHRGVKHFNDRKLLPTIGVTDDQVRYSDFPSKSGNTHGMVKVTVSTENNAPTKRAKKINWSVSTISLHLKEALSYTMKSLNRFSISPKVNINNNIIPYPATSSIDMAKSNWETNSCSNENY